MLYANIFERRKIKKRTLEYYGFTLEKIQKIRPDVVKIGNPQYDKTKGKYRLPMISKDGSRQAPQCARIIYELDVGDKLPSSIEVHHVDQVKTNDDLSNLSLESKKGHKHLHIPPNYMGGPLYHHIVCQECFIKKWIHRNVLMTGYRRKQPGPFCSRECGIEYRRAVKAGATPLPPMDHPDVWPKKRFEKSPY